MNLSSEDCQVVLIRRSAGCFVCLFEQYELESTVRSVTEAQNCPSWVPRGRDLQIVSFVSVLSLSGAEPVYRRWWLPLPCGTPPVSWENATSICLWSQPWIRSDPIITATRIQGGAII